MTRNVVNTTLLRVWRSSCASRLEQQRDLSFTIQATPDLQPRVAIRLLVDFCRTQYRSHSLVQFFSQRVQLHQVGDGASYFVWQQARHQWNDAFEFGVPSREVGGSVQFVEKEYRRRAIARACQQVGVVAHEACMLKSFNSLDSRAEIRVGVAFATKFPHVRQARDDCRGPLRHFGSVQLRSFHSRSTSHHSYVGATAT